MWLQILQIHLKHIQLFCYVDLNQNYSRDTMALTFQSLWNRDLSTWSEEQGSIVDIVQCYTIQGPCDLDGSDDAILCHAWCPYYASNIVQKLSQLPQPTIISIKDTAATGGLGRREQF